MERSDEGDRSVLEAMEAEHADLDPILEGCAAGFTRLAARPDEDARAALAVRLVAGRERLGEHLRHEETEAIALIQQVLSPEDWAAIEQQHFRAGIGLRDVLSLVPWAIHGLPGPARREVFSRTGTAHRLMWLATRRGFARRERTAFRHVA